MLAAARRALAFRSGVLRAPIAAASNARAFTEAALQDATEDEDLAEFRESVRGFAQEVIAPLAADIDRANNLPQHINLWQALGEFGLHVSMQVSLAAHRHGRATRMVVYTGSCRCSAGSIVSGLC